MSAEIVYSLILATIFTFSFSIFSCSYCLSHCDYDDEEEEMPESVKHMFS